MLVLLAVFASMRWGELMGLRRADLDLESASVNIDRSAVEIGKRIVIKAPKTRAGIRSVALPVWLVPELVHHLDTFAESGPEGPGVSRGLWRDALSEELRDDLGAGEGGGWGAGGSALPRLAAAGNHFAAARARVPAS